MMELFENPLIGVRQIGQSPERRWVSLAHGKHLKYNLIFILIQKQNPHAHVPTPIDDRIDPVVHAN